VRIRLGNLGPMDHHPIHIHGLSFQRHGDRRRLRAPPSGAADPRRRCWCRSGSTRVIEFVPTEPGDWAMHCHMTHHVMTQMGHGIPSMVGADTSALDRA
jgi:FtsP/CotA-like multicopper oxidase with cupredoxin domain